MYVSADRPHRRRNLLPSPVFLGVLALTAVGGVLAWTQNTAGSRLGDFGVFLFVLAGWIVSVCLHEFAHAFAAYRAGDRSVVDAGYLTLNPLRYAHPLLSVVLPVVAMIGGGFALPGGAVYLHRHTFRSRAMMSLASAAGPLVNVALAIALVGAAQANDGSAHVRFWPALAYLGFLQITAAVLNLLPIPGLDGFAIIEPYLDPQTRQYADRIKPWGMLALIVALFYLDPVRSAFFDLVRGLYGLIDPDGLLWQFGYTAFRFWVRQPV